MEKIDLGKQPKKRKDYATKILGIDVRDIF